MSIGIGFSGSNLEQGGRGMAEEDVNLFSGSYDIPYRTKASRPPLVKQDDPTHKKPKTVHDVKVRVFDTAVSEDLAAYQKVLNLCARGLGRVIDQKMEFLEDDKSWKIFLSWAVYFLENPAETRNDNKKYYT